MSAHSSESIFHVGEVVANRFEVTGRGTAGRLGAVYRAHDREIEVDVALKVIHPHLVPDDHQRREFVEKMSRAQTLSHPNVARAYAAIVDRGRALLVMQYTPGVNLETLVGMRTSASAVSDPRYRWAEARPVLGQIAAGLAHVHGQGMIHGDVRPASVVVLPDGVKLTSVGVGMALPRDAFLGAVAGPGWERIAPEIRARAPVTARADVYSFAVLAIELLTASLPHSPLRVFGARGPFDQALERALEEVPDRRFPTIEALLTELDRTAPGAAPRERPRHNTNPGPAPAPQKPQAPLREATERVDEEELRRLAGEVGELLDTTRRADAEEIEDLRLESRRPSDDLDFEEGVPGGPLGEATNPGRPSAISALPERVRTAPDLVHELAATTTPVVRVAPEDVQPTVPIEKLPEEVVRPAELPAPPTQDEFETLRVPLVDEEEAPIEPLKRSTTFSLEKDDDDPTVTISDRTPLPPPMPASTAPLVTPSPVSVSAIAAAARSAPATVARPLTPPKTPQGKEPFPAGARPPASSSSPPEMVTPVVPTDGSASLPPAMATPVARPSGSQSPPATVTPVARPTGKAPASGSPPAMVTPVARPTGKTAPPLPPDVGSLPPPMTTPTGLPPPPPPPSGADLPRRMTPPSIPAIPTPTVSTPPPIPLAAMPRSTTPPSVPASSGSRSATPPAVPAAAMTPRIGAQGTSSTPQTGVPIAAIAPRSTPPSGTPLSSMPPKPPASTAPTMQTSAPVIPPPAPTVTSEPPGLPPPPLPPPPSPAFSFVPDPPRANARPAPVQIAPQGNRPVLLMAIVGAAVLALACVAGLVIWMFHLKPRVPMPRPAPLPIVAPAPVAGTHGTSAPPSAPVSVPPPVTLGAGAPGTSVPSVPRPAAPAPPRAPAAPAAAADGPCPAGADLMRVSPPYCIDRHEYPGKGEIPRTGVSRDEAAKLCAERGERLCSEKEWERACRGPGGTSYPYGTTYQAGRCNTQGGPVRAAGSFIDCRSGSGAYDMSGNVAEWTEAGMVKGGAAGEGDPAGRCSHHVKSHGAAQESVGFRCCARPR